MRRTLLLAGAAALARPAGGLAAGSPLPAGLIYTRENPGRWAGKEASHSPQVAVEGTKVTITTPHPMSAEHYIVRHSLVSRDGTVVGAKTFTPADKEAVSTYELNAGGAYFAASFCNLHDFWVTEFTA